MTMILVKPCRLLLFSVGALLSVYVWFQDQTEIGRVSVFLQSSLATEDTDTPLAVARKSSVADGTYGGGTSTIQLTVGDPGMMNRTIPILALDPHHPGRLVAFVNVMAHNCTDRLAYTENAGAIVAVHIGDTLVHGHPTQGEWIKSVHTTVEINIPLSAYQQLQEQGNGVQIKVRDLVTGTDYIMPLVVDPTPKNYLSGLVWINKARRYYEGRKEDNGKVNWRNNRRREDVGNRLGPAPRNDAYTLSHLLPWIQYHRGQGVQHIYILDQETNFAKPNFPLTPPFLTYIRAPYAFMDYFVDSCDPNTHQVVQRLRMAVLQHILDSLVLRMTSSEWMIISDLDEFIVPAAGEGSLPQLVKEFSTLHCEGLPYLPHYRNPMWEQWQNIRCTPTRRPIFELQFYQLKMGPNNTITLSTDRDDYWALTKNIYHVPYVARSRVHFGYPLHDSAVSTKVLPHRGFMAHFRNGAPTTQDLKLVPFHGVKLRRFSYEDKDEEDDDLTPAAARLAQRHAIKSAIKDAVRSNVPKKYSHRKQPDSDATVASPVVEEGHRDGDSEGDGDADADPNSETRPKETVDDTQGQEENPAETPRQTTSYASGSVIGTGYTSIMSDGTDSRNLGDTPNLQTMQRMASHQDAQSAVVKMKEEGYSDEDSIEVEEKKTDPTAIVQEDEAAVVEDEEVKEPSADTNAPPILDRRQRQTAYASARVARRMPRV